jgi:signal transduction histidine kinase
MAGSFVTRADPRLQDLRRRMEALRRARHGDVVLYVLSAVALAGAYYLAGRIGLELAYLDGAVAALWPPAGLGLAALFRFGVRLWPGIVVGDLLLGDFSTPLGTVLGQTLGNTVSLVVAALLLRRLTGGRGQLDRVVDVLAFVACALVAATVSAAFGPTALRLGDVIGADELGRVFRTWTLSDAAGVLVVAPVILTWGVGWGRRELSRLRLAEGAVVLALLVLLAELPPQRDVPYIVFPVLLWAALRFGPRGAAAAILVVCSITVWNTAQTDGPFVRGSITDSLLATQLFIAVSAVTSLLLAAVTAERTRAEAAQRALAEKLAASRARLVQASDAERRRLERNLHDGAQQRLVTLALQLRMVGAQLERDPAGARDALTTAEQELTQGLEELRELARGIHPAVLTDRGLGPAVQARVARAPLPVDVEELPDERLSAPVEAGVYYVVAEAVTNATKYARASGVTVSIRRVDGAATVTVADDGIGGADPGGGTGLRGLADRLEALNGRLDVVSPARRGTRVHAVIPCPD